MDRVLTDHHPQTPRQGLPLLHPCSNHLSINFSGRGLHAKEWRQGGPRVDALLEHLAKALSITQVHNAPQGSGKPCQLKLRHQHPETFKLIK